MKDSLLRIHWFPTNIQQQLLQRLVLELLPFRSPELVGIPVRKHIDLVSGLDLYCLCLKGTIPVAIIADRHPVGLIFFQFRTSDQVQRVIGPGVCKDFLGSIINTNCHIHPVLLFFLFT